LNHPAHAEDIDLEHAAHLFFSRPLDRREIADARVVHEHINATELFFGGLMAASI